jgi:hypothetical protein
VKYVDPHFVNAHGLDVPLSKHFRYSDQSEVRAFWGPPAPRMDLKPFFVHLGNLKDCATLITLPSPMSTTGGST